MERRKFLSRSLATLGLGLVFPSLIRGSQNQESTVISETDLSLYTKDRLISAQYPLHPDECFRRVDPMLPVKESVSCIVTDCNGTMLKYGGDLVGHDRWTKEFFICDTCEAAVGKPHLDIIIRK